MLPALRGFGGASGPALPDEVQVDLVRALYEGLPAILAICVAVMVSAAAIGFHLSDPVYIWLAACSLVTILTRAGLFFAFKHRAQRSLGADEARRWNIAYGVVSIAFAAVFACLISYGFTHGDVGAIFVIADLAILYTSQSARISTQPWIGLTAGSLISISVIHGIASQTAPIYWALAAFLSLFFLAYVKSVLNFQKALIQRLGAQRDVEYLARHDTLTGLVNRTAFSTHLSDALERCEPGNLVALHFIDLDRFKQVNDTIGHKAGDELLCAVAERLKAESAHGGRLATRIGGDEFIVLQTDLNSDLDGAKFAEHLCQQLAEIGRPYGVTASIGMALYPSDATNAEALIRNADIALYEAKAAGRDTFRSYDVAAADRLREYQTLQHDLRHAVDTGGLHLVYQPQARTRDGAAIGFEVLVRWTHPALGVIGPDRFIPMAEEAGVICALGAWVLESACAEAATWDPNLAIAVNLSPVQIVTGDLAALVAEVLERTGLAATRLELEITEGIFIADTERTLAVLTAIKAMGVRIAMDDFGTGYSSLSYLQAFPFDRIKIDRSFVSNLETSHHSRTIVRAVTSLGKGLGIPVLAEGVETEVQRSLLMQEGCHEMQGYLLSKPAAIETFRAITHGKVAQDTPGPLRGPSADVAAA